MALPYTVKVLEDCHVSPPPNSVPPTSLPLTFFDILWFLCHPVKRVFFYEYPYPTLHFTNTILPWLKQSLSLTLQHFFPLAATLRCPSYPDKPYIQYTDGDSVPLTIAESTGNFIHLFSNYPRDVREFHKFVPQLPMAFVWIDTDVEQIPLLALQVTIFPNSGICIGVTFSHVVADGKTFHHFMKSWASIFRSQGDLSCIDKSLPFYNRSAVVKDSEGLEALFLKEWWTWTSFWKEGTPISLPEDHKLRATFVLGRYDIERLKQWISTECENHSESRPLHMSTFVVTCAFIWFCMTKSQDSVMCKNKSLDDDNLHHFVFLADCRNRHGISVPTTYFGNCLAACFLTAKKAELVGENGVVVAAKAIGSKVKELESGVLIGAHKWMSKWKELKEVGNFLVVAGSPKLSVYNTDFGWGRPKKSEVVHVDLSGTISITESRDEEGGIEVGLALSRIEMEAFMSSFHSFGPTGSLFCSRPRFLKSLSNLLFPSFIISSVSISPLINYLPMGRAPCCDKNGLKKGPWTPEEDLKLSQYIQIHGPGNWRTLPKNAGLQRCGKSCRLRWTNYLRPDIKRGRFSFEEEETIIQLHSIMGNKWSAIAARLPGRTDNEIKNFWNTHIRKRLLRMGIDPVTHSPRLDLLDLSSLLNSSLCSSSQLNLSSLFGMQQLVNPELLRLTSTLLSLKHENPELLLQNLQENQIHPFQPNHFQTPTQEGQASMSSSAPYTPFLNQTQLMQANVEGFMSNMTNFSCPSSEENLVPSNLVENFLSEPNYGYMGSDQTTPAALSENMSFQSLNNSNQNFSFDIDSVISTPLSSSTPLNSSSACINGSTEDERESYSSDMLKFEIPESFDISEFM
ncbi:hypothetical protein L1049_023684 [Liquidambar formosana]|uniref:Uncharacterized protein n=2 Tax=Pentapetalae TaxID=1437201 RepID=A0AAP0S0K7_LIQFO